MLSSILKLKYCKRNMRERERERGRERERERVRESGG